MKALLLSVAAVFTIACTYAQQSTIKPAAPGVTYGKTITKDKAITLAGLSKELNKDTVYTGKITGEVPRFVKRKVAL